jgi:hypothetical protein
MRDLLWIAVALPVAIIGGYNIVTLRNENCELKERTRESDIRVERLKEEVAWKTKEVNLRDEEIRLAKREAMDKVAILEQERKAVNAEFKERVDSLRLDYERRLDEQRAAYEREIASLDERRVDDKSAIRSVVLRNRVAGKCLCCDGKGFVEVEKTCDACDGKGFTVEVVDRVRRYGHHGSEYYVSPYKTSQIEHCCLVCKEKNSLDRRGTGRIRVMEPCPRCHGRGAM